MNPTRPARPQPGRVIATLTGLLVLSALTVYFLTISFPATDSPLKAPPTVRVTEPEPLAPRTLRNTQQLDPATMVPKPEPLIALSVLPLRVIGEPAGFFDQGLHRQIESALTRLTGVRVVNNRMGRAQLGEDLQAMGAELGVDYLLDASIRRAGDELRLQASLIDMTDGTVVFSESFDGRLVDVFETQTALSIEVAAALGVKLSKEDYQYGLYPVAQFGHAGVARLLELRTMTYSAHRDQYVVSARQELEAMDQAFPDNPYILGLLALARRSENMSKGYSHTTQDNIALAERTLALDPNNLDALTVLVHIYDELPHTLQQADALQDHIVELYPGYSWMQKKRLVFKGLTLKVPCDDGLYLRLLMENPHISASEKAFYKLSLLTCIDRSAYKAALDSAAPGLRHSVRYWVEPDYGFLSDVQRRESRQSGFDPFDQAVYYEYLLWFGQTGKARKLIAGAALDPNSNVTRMLVSSALLNGERLSLRPSDLVDYQIERSVPVTGLRFSKALALEARQTGNQAPLQRFLAAVPPFPLDVSTVEFGIGLIALQYHSEQPTLAEATAIKLHEALHAYSIRTPNSERAYWLTPYHFLLAYYSGNQAEAPGLLERMIDNEEVFWWRGGYLHPMLEPWEEDPTVQRFHQLVAEDRSRIAAKAGFSQVARVEL